MGRKQTRTNNRYPAVALSLSARVSISTMGGERYVSTSLAGALLDYPVSKVVCVGSNLCQHIKEMGSAVPKSQCCLLNQKRHCCDLQQPLAIPSISVQFIMKSNWGVDWRDAASGYGRASAKPLPVTARRSIWMRDVQGK